MQKISSTTDLRDAIFQLELKKELQAGELKEHFYSTFNSLKTVNIGKKILVEIATSPGLLNGIIRTVAEITIHRIIGHPKSQSKSTSNTNSSIKNVVFSLIRTVASSFIIHNADIFKLYGRNIIRKILGKRVKKVNRK